MTFDSGMMTQHSFPFRKFVESTACSALGVGLAVCCAEARVEKPAELPVGRPGCPMVGHWDQQSQHWAGCGLGQVPVVSRLRSLLVPGPGRQVIPCQL
ncbi:hypothetical protein HPB47_003614 [Ixodes persulcatus]|uniref:Uncharacterized protein n=1 Tax=Ixodes persulcatus TaxID=34615 RepID=A0AC60PI39_IXOPE|nr:hypothetical protein HPB47_003614 [Ixodes persulcatus]